ncbi:MBOAT family O-acyltransferase [Chamaesiphon sp. GL140_3_metabinner_50]|uniref:MBOAT family O-acyltransferase n=1 Tax=Chamaesiphon sp. GL140_3_metabinner_50 TaxID=2970812 RepID=UPI0025FBA399|nr:MBOAT family O-acyltransferase [Chamaesiphon sp. GL140_3_metabinner_50]
MKFISPAYAIFLCITLIFYWGIAKQQNQKLWVIVISSIGFYISFRQLQYFPVILAMILANYWIGKILLESQIIEYKEIQDRLGDDYFWRWLPRGKQQRQRVLIAGIVFNILLLIAAKYIPFIVSIFAPINPTEIQPLAIWLKANFLPPLGISFLSFESAAYLIDVYKGSPATGNLLKYAAYKSFFPKLVSGPITHYHQFAPQLNNLRFPTIERLTEAGWLIANGAIKKTLIADNLAIFVKLVFDPNNLDRAGSIDLWLAIFAYGLQLYLDFSGYVDIVLGTAILFGVNLPTNFNFPYMSTSIADFWRRWHISLGNWLRDYIYFPLGGSRLGLLRTCLNLFLLMLISGLWHGADWGYIVWGAIHGSALVIHRLTHTLSERIESLARFWRSSLGNVVGWFLTQLLVFVTWIWFRLPSLAQSNLVFQHLWGYPRDAQFATKIYVENLKLADSQMLLILIGITLAMMLAYLFDRVLKLNFNWHLKLTLIPLCLYIVWLLSPAESLAFIYFDF